jgi:dTDP-4-amino-4,6-dideoxygalactose transaminase
VSPIPLVDLQAAHREVADEIRAGFDRVISATAFIGGAEVGEFEREFAAFADVRHCVGVGNGTDAIELALRAADLPPGGGVILPANTFVATAEAVLRAGLRPVIVDIDPEHLLIDPACVGSAAGSGDLDVVAVLPVHLFGQMAPMKEILDTADEHGLVVIEDAAQSQGAVQGGRPSGSLGRLAATSFYPGKNLGAYGDAGAVLTDSDALADRVRLLGNHGSARKYEHSTLGFNSRLDTLQAVVLRAKLARLAEWNQRRRAAAARYDELLAGLDGVVRPRTLPGNEHVWHLYVIRVPRRDEVLAYLNAEGVGAGIHYPVPVHLQPAFRDLGYAPGDFRVAEQAGREILSLPLYPQITAEQQARVVEVLARALRLGITHD